MSPKNAARVEDKLTVTYLHRGSTARQSSKDALNRNVFSSHGNIRYNDNILINAANELQALATANRNTLSVYHPV